MNRAMFGRSPPIVESLKKASILSGSEVDERLILLVRLLARQTARQAQAGKQVSSSPDVVTDKVAKPPQPMGGSK
jgi:hypothetical protein